MSRVEMDPECHVFSGSDFDVFDQAGLNWNYTLFSLVLNENTAFFHFC